MMKVRDVLEKRSLEGASQEKDSTTNRWSSADYKKDKEKAKGMQPVPTCMPVRVMCVHMLLFAHPCGWGANSFQFSFVFLTSVSNV